ncbi:MAG: radical SAM protein [Lachnospiraceae bacterium]|nr:radical SAM protein [Lachnospiraceae bacterium]
MSSYFNKIFKPCINEIHNLIPGHKGIGAYARVARDLILPGRAVFQDIVVILTTRCSLNCKNCNNLMPLYDKPYHLDTDTVIADILKLLENVDTIIKFGLLGGEPLIYPELGRVLQVVLESPKVMFADITTNATVLPDSSLLKLMRHPKMFVEISNYGVKTQKVQDFAALMRENGIRHTVDKATSWVAPGGTEQRGKSREQLEKEYNACYSSRYCRTMLNGKLYLCARGAHLCDLGYMKSEHDVFDVRNTPSGPGFREGMKRFYLSDYAEACNYCDHALGKKVKPGEQLKRK